MIKINDKTVKGNYDRIVVFEISWLHKSSLSELRSRL